MKHLAYGMVGIIIGIAVLSLLTPGYLWIAATYLFVLYILFFRQDGLGLAFLIGFTISLELLAPHAFGLATLVSAIAFLSAELSRKYLSFTSPYSRFIVAMLVTLVAIGGIFYGKSGMAGHYLGMAVVGLIAAALSAAAQRIAERTRYELI